MTIAKAATRQRQALELTGKIAAVPAIAAPLLRLLKQAGNDPAKLEALTVAALAAINDQLAESGSIESRRDALLKEFRIRVVGEGKVRLALGETPRIKFLQKVQKVASELHGRPAIFPQRLERWAADRAYTAKPSSGGKIGVNGNVFGSTWKTRAEQEAKGWNNVDLCDLAVAHAAYFLATGKDLFAGNAVRARGGALYFFTPNGGLCVHDYNANSRDENVAASAALRSRNSRRVRTRSLELTHSKIKKRCLTPGRR